MTQGPLLVVTHVPALAATYGPVLVVTQGPVPPVQFAFVVQLFVRSPWQ